MRFGLSYDICPLGRGEKFFKGQVKVEPEIRSHPCPRWSPGYGPTRARYKCPALVFLWSGKAWTPAGRGRVRIHTNREARESLLSLTNSCERTRREERRKSAVTKSVRDATWCGKQEQEDRETLEIAEKEIPKNKKDGYEKCDQSAETETHRLDTGQKERQAEQKADRTVLIDGRSL
ncbi:hypothetical protein R1flu_019094 [Riccia fluitans]|uniref:Uncharacterized protein n=1 Tax=Riccia fluitans TaxID=41844 RepID=A0ABD1ZJ84_9MARC